MRSRLGTRTFTRARTILALFCTSLGAETAMAGTDQATLIAGMIYYGTTSGSSLSGLTGNFIQFQSESRKAAFRPGFSVQIESASGSATGIGGVTYLAGQLGLGADYFLFKTDYVKPYFGTHALLGWGYAAIDAETKLGLEYGAQITGGAEIRLRTGEDRKGLRVLTGYRFLRGSLNGLTQFDGFLIGLGFVF